MKENGSGFDSLVGYGARPIDSEEIEPPAGDEKLANTEPGPLDRVDRTPEPQPEDVSGEAPEVPEGGAPATREHTEGDSADAVVHEETARESAFSVEEGGMPHAETTPVPVDEGDAPAGNEEAAVDSHVELVCDAGLPSEALGPTAAEEEARPRAGGRKKKGKQSSKRADALRRPTQQEVFQRLMEKNEVILQLSKKNLELEASRKSADDKRIQLLSEFDNYRKRTRAEWDLLKHQARVEVLAEVLNVVDDFERAFVALGDREDEFVQGIRLIYNNLIATLVRFGVTKMIALGERFDPNYHMAVSHTESEEVESNRVVEVIQDGFLIDGAVLRPASVVIAK